MAIVERMALDTTRAGALRLVAAYTLFATLLASGVGGMLSVVLGTPFLAQMFGGACIGLLIAPLLVWPLAKVSMELRARESRFERQAQTDSMTGVLNRRGFFAAGATLFAPPANAPLVAMLIDLDRFKQVNDTYGHAAGDDAVIAASAAIVEAVGRLGVVGRIGGDEFCVLVPNVSETVAASLAEHIRSAVEARSVRNERRMIRVTVSIGYAARTREDATLDAVLARADAALYAAKSCGRNCASPALETRAARRRA